MVTVRRPLRLDDLGASSKQFEWWSRRRWANVWPLHSRYLFGAWGPYRELTEWELQDIFGIVDAAAYQLTVAITPYWVERDGRLVFYPEKFPAQARIVKWWADRGTVRVAMHGLTHCIPGRHCPRWIGGNRRWHREITFGNGDYAPAHARFMAWLGHPIPRIILPGAPPGDEVVFHDRDFVLDWDRAMSDLKAAVGCAE